MRPRPSPARTYRIAGLVAGLLALVGHAAAQSLVVSPEGPDRTLRAAVEAAGPGDTVRVLPGIYEETIRIDRALTVLGEGRPMIDGGGEGHVIEILAPATVRGLAIRGSGTRVDAEHAGIMVRGARVEIRDNRIEDVLYGIYLKQAPGSLVAENVIAGKPLPPPRRGDGIRLWRSADSRVERNRVVGTRDVVIYFSDGLEVRGNVVTDGRYGLHYMYSDDNRIVGNRFERNEVGAFLMYSREILLEENVFADSRGATGIGLGLKDADRIEARDNLIYGNAAGIHLDNSPSEVRSPNRLAENLILLNEVGIRILPSVRGNRFEGNELVSNARDAEVAGGATRGQAEQNGWEGNHWAAYAGFDRDGDGRGDTPHVYAKLADDLLSRHPRLATFEGSPALRLLDLLARFFPLLAPEPVLIDSAPLLERRLAPRWAVALDTAGTGAGKGSALPWAAALAGALAAAAAVSWGGRPS